MVKVLDLFTRGTNNSKQNEGPEPLSVRSPTKRSEGGKKVFLHRFAKLWDSKLLQVGKREREETTESLSEKNDFVQRLRKNGDHCKTMCGAFWARAQSKLFEKRLFRR
jgi:hypothetical protein